MHDAPRRATLLRMIARVAIPLAAAALSVLALRWPSCPPRPTEPVLVTTRTPPSAATIVHTSSSPTMPPITLTTIETERCAAIAAENHALRAANEQMTLENNRLRRQLNDVLSWILENFQGRYAIPERMVEQLDIPAVTEDFRVHDDLVELLRLTASERARLDEAFRAARTMAEAVELSVMRPSMPSAGELVIEIPPHAEQGREIRTHLLAALESALGSNRAPWAAAAAARDLDRRFYGFGADHRTIRMELVYRPNTAEPWIRITDERTSLARDGRLRRESLEWTTNTVPVEYVPYIGRLPSD